MIKSPLIISVSLLMAGVFIVMSASSNQKKFVKYQNQYKNLEELKKEKLFQALNNIEDAKPNQVVLSISNRELNEALYYFIKDNEHKAVNKIGETEFNGEIIEEAIVIYIDKKVFNVINLQFGFEFYPKIKDNQITLELTKTWLGYIKLPKKSVMKYIKSMKNNHLDVDIKSSSIGFITDVPKQFNFGFIKAAKDELRIAVDIDIKNLEDLKEAVKFAVPPNLSYIVDIIPFSLLIGNDNDISKRFTLKQIQTIMGFVMKYVE